MNHPNVLTLCGVVVDASSTAWLITEPVTMAYTDYLASLSRPLSLHDVKDHCSQVLAGLAYLHKRRVQPESYCLRPDAIAVRLEGDRPRLLISGVEFVVDGAQVFSHGYGNTGYVYGGYAMWRESDELVKMVEVALMHAYPRGVPPGEWDMEAVVASLCPPLLPFVSLLCSLRGASYMPHDDLLRALQSASVPAAEDEVGVGSFGTYVRVGVLPPFKCLFIVLVCRSAALA